MGLIKAIGSALSTNLADQWREYFYCDSIASDILMVKGKKRINDAKSSNTKASDNIISNGSVIAVNEGQCMLIVEQGKVVDICAEAGEYTYDMSTEPSLFYGSLGQNIKNTFMNIGRRFTFGGDTAKDQRVYFINTKEIMNNLFGTPSPVPFRIVDMNIGLDLDTAVRCNGEYTFHIADPIIFYTNICANVPESYSKQELLQMMKAELVTALQPALAEISAMGVRYSEIPAHAEDLTNILNKKLSDKWGNLRGIEMVSMALNPLKLSEEDEKMVKELQRTAVMRNANMAAATLVSAQADAMRSAASNTSTGPMMAFAGMNMAQMAGGMDANSLFAMGAQQQAQQQMQAQQPQQMQAPSQAAPAKAPVLGWTCACGKADNQGKFCAECGAPKPAASGWTCSCGHENTGKFCQECGAKKPEGAPLYRCDKCGWEPEDPKNPPKFCPNCGDIFDDNDRV